MEIKYAVMIAVALLLLAGVYLILSKPSIQTRPSLEKPKVQEVTSPEIPEINYGEIPLPEDIAPETNTEINIEIPEIPEDIPLPEDI